MPRFQAKSVELFSISLPKEILAFARAIRGKELIDVQLRVFLGVTQHDKRGIKLSPYIQENKANRKKSEIILLPHHATYSNKFHLNGHDLSLVRVFKDVAATRTEHGFKRMYVNVLSATIAVNNVIYGFKYLQRRLRLASINGEPVSFTRKEERDKLLNGDLKIASATKCVKEFVEVISCQ